MRRWQDEHDRLSRAATLAALARDNVQYSLPTFAEHLPGNFKGYLIRSSRRLGMEGLRQRHCVASYHSLLQAGSCVILSMFVQRQRWTVQVMTSGKADAPLRIQQIKTRFNTAPGPQVLKDICDMLGIKQERLTEAAPDGEPARV